MLQGLTHLGHFDNIVTGYFTFDNGVLEVRPAYGMAHAYNSDLIGVDPNFEIKSDYNSLQSGQSIYIYKDSIIPRETTANNFKRVIKKEKADVMVIPHNYTRSLYANHGDVFIFTSQTTALILSYYCSTPPFSVGESFPTSAKINNNSNVSIQLSDFKFAFKGNCIITVDDSVQDWVFDADTLLTSKIVVTDQDFMKFSRSLTDSSDIGDLCESVIDLLKSSDDDTRFLGYKTLASLNYPKFPHSISLLIRIGASCNRNGGNAVAFMESYLKEIPKKVITQEDWELFTRILIKNGDISYITDCKFVTLDDQLRLIPKLVQSY